MRRTVSAVLCTLVCLAASNRSATAQTLIFDDFSDLSGFTLNGSASGAVNASGEDVLRLTTATYSQSGSAFVTEPISLAGDVAFSSAFSFQITNSGGCCYDTDGGGADGLVFVITQTPNAVGSAGVGIGYAGIPNSIGIEFDTWNNYTYWGDYSGNHVAVNWNGNIHSSIGYADIGPRMNDGDVWYVWVDYDGATTTLDVRLSMLSERPEAATISVIADLRGALGETVYVGFTSGTGGAYGNHDIRALQFEDEYDPIGANAAPDVSGATASLGTIWPPNKKMVDIGIEGVIDEDGDEVTITIDAITNDETGADDASFSGSAASVRADRDGNGDGRTYTIEFTADDGNGGVTTGSVTVEVPHDQRGAKRGSGKAAASVELRSWAEVKKQVD